MYLYFDKKGVLKTKIDHGETVRQGSVANVYVCVDTDHFAALDNTWGLTMNIQTNNVDISNNIPSTSDGLDFFNKIYDSEATYDLIDGEEYYIYYFRINPEYTNLGQNLKLYFSFIKSGEEPRYLGIVDVNVEKTFNQRESLISELHYNNFINQIQDIRADIRLIQNKMLGYDAHVNDVTIHISAGDDNELAIFVDDLFDGHSFEELMSDSDLMLFIENLFDENQEENNNGESL